MAEGTRIKRVLFRLDGPDEDPFNTHLIEYEDNSQNTPNTKQIEHEHEHKHDDMDPEIARMMADLGANRRDYLSAPEFDKGKIMEENADATNEYEARRNRIINNAPEDNDQARFLRKWNTRATFERDELAENLENRYSGQAHRAALNAAFNRPNYVTEPATDRDRSSSEFEPRSFANSNPAGKSNGHDGMRGRSAMKTAPNPNRAPSPRAAGRVRFVNGQRVEIAAANGTAGAPPPATKALATSRTIGNAAGTIASKVVAKPVISSAQPATLTFNDEIILQRNKNLAVYFAVKPGQQSDKYYNKNPDQKPLLRAAYVLCIKDALAAARFPDSESETVKRGKEEERAWMLKEAHKAKEYVESNKLTEAEAYYTAHPQHIDFFKGAKANFKPKVNNIMAAEIIDLTDDLDSTTLTDTAMTPASSIKTVMSENGKTTGNVQTDAVTTSSTKPVTANTAASMVKPATTTTGVTSGTPPAMASSANRVVLPAVSRKAAGGNITSHKPVIMENGTVNGVQSKPTDGEKTSTTASVTTNRVSPGTFPGDRSAQANAAATLLTQQKENNGGMLGFLNACIRDAVGNLISKHTWPIGDQHNVDVNAITTGGRTTRDIISSMESLAESLRKISAVSNAQSAAHEAESAAGGINSIKDGGKTGYKGFEAEIMDKGVDYVPYGLQREMEIMPDEDGLYDE